MIFLLVFVSVDMLLVGGLGFSSPVVSFLLVLTSICLWNHRLYSLSYMFILSVGFL